MRDVPNAPSAEPGAPRRAALGRAGVLLLLLALPGCDRGAALGTQGGTLAASEAPSAPSPEPAAPIHALDQRPSFATVGLDSARLAEAFERAATLARLHNMIVARHGQVLGERRFRGPPPDQPVNVKSASKSILSAVVGIAIAEGHLEGTEQPAAPFFARHLGESPEPARTTITLGHLLSMRSGLESTSGSNYGRWVSTSDWVRHAITRPMVAPPGQQMTYSTGSTHLLSAIVTQATGQSTYDYARARLATPMGIRLPAWPRDPQGIYFGGNDMLISARDLLRFGEMYRNGGRYEGEQIVPEAWVRASWEVLARGLRGGGSSNNRNSYGLGWWGRDSNGYAVRFAWGYGGQFLFVVPALELTVVFTSDPYSQREGPHNQQLHRLMDELLVPAAIAGASASASTGAVAGR
jgi:CubicO group peptidase (beta-lactamase class C family)